MKSKKKKGNKHVTEKIVLVTAILNLIDKLIDLIEKLIE